MKSFSCLVSLVLLFSYSSPATPAPSSSNSAIINWTNQVFTYLGVNKILDGSVLNRQGPLKGPLNVLPTADADNRHYIHLAAAAYCPRSLETWTCPSCLPGYTYLGQETNDTLQTLVYFAVNQERSEILVGFRGSQNALNFALDLIPIFQVDSGVPGIKLHAGYKIMTDSLYPLFLARLTTYVRQFPDYKIVLTGHSLGASEAGITLFYLKSQNRFPGKTFEMYTYGMIAIGNRAYADYMNALPIKIARVVERGDLAPHISPAVLGYYHIQREVWVYDITGNGTDQTCSTSVYEDPNCSDSRGPLYSIVDHFTYYNVDLLATCYLVEDPIIVLLDFIVPLKNLIPGPLLALIPTLPVTENGPVAQAFRAVTQLLG